MQVKIYVPKIIEIPSEFLPAWQNGPPTASVKKPTKYPPPAVTWSARRSRTGCYGRWTS